MMARNWTDAAIAVAQLRIYPIKSLDPVMVPQVTVLPSGALQGDRTYALVDERGQFVNGKREARIHLVRSQFDLAAHTVTLWVQDEPHRATFHLDQDRDRLNAWFSVYLGRRVTLQQNTEMGFPDDTVSPGATIISTASLGAIAQWYPHSTVEAMRRRFRANIELGECPAFWEDHLFGETGQPVAFQVGTVQFWGINPCQRCVVVTRDPDTGKGDRQFQQTFITQRQQSLPADVARSPFNHFFRLAVNTRVPPSEAGKVIHLGDLVSVGGVAE